MKKMTLKKFFITVITLVTITCGTFAAMTTFAYAETDLPEVEVTVNENEIVNETIENESATEIENNEETIINEENQVEINEITEVESKYGVATGNEGIGNESGNVVWKEYEKDGHYTMVFSVNDNTLSDEECAITTQFRNTEYASRTNRIVLEEGISGAGWTYLYDKSGYNPLYPEEGYTLDRSKTDIFNNFKVLSEVVPSTTLKRIGWSAFKGCTSLTSFDFTICSNLQEVMNQAFYNTKSFETVDLSNCNSLTLLAWSSFNNAGNGKTAVMILPADEELTVIGGHALDGWKNVIRAEVKPVEEEVIEEEVIEEEIIEEEIIEETPVIEELEAEESIEEIVIIYATEDTDVQEIIDEMIAQEVIENEKAQEAAQEVLGRVNAPIAVQETIVDAAAPLAAPAVANTVVQEMIEDADAPLATQEMTTVEAEDSIEEAAIPMVASSVADTEVPMVPFIIGMIVLLALAALILITRRKEQE